MDDLIYMGRGVYDLLFLFLFWGFSGWVIEVVDMRIETGEFQNRGFLHMPICPLYGLGMPLLNALVGSRRDSYLFLFIGGMVFCTLVEYFVGWLLETVFNARWWDYSHMKFNLHGRICLRNSLLFGLGAVICIGFIHPVVESLVHKIFAPVASGIFIVATAALAADIVMSVRRALNYRQEQGEKGAFVIFKSHR